MALLALTIGLCGVYASQPAALQPAAGAGGNIGIAVHQALYDFKLFSAAPSAGINAVRGKMYFEQDDTCDAWTTDRRFTTEYQYVDDPADTDASHYVAFESKDQRQFSFSSERQENGEMTEQLRGSVEIAPDGTAKAVYARPDDLGYDLPKGYLLPTGHTMDVIRHARAGDKFFSAALFDGTDAEGPVEVGTFIGKKAAADEIKKIAGANKNIDASLLTPDAWHIRMAVFPLKDREESAPAYEMDVIMHDNGVVSYARVVYKTFSVEQRLKALEKLPPKKCS
ncbi:MAG: cell envelope integrity EipB family protein [Alphaproteobacteria bacterium]|nr:cell envelope integrity EipB family protein [Alphaproteobacteria bacterium]